MSDVQTNLFTSLSLTEDAGRLFDQIVGVLKERGDGSVEKFLVVHVVGGDLSAESSLVDDDEA